MAQYMAVRDKEPLSAYPLPSQGELSCYDTIGGREDVYGEAKYWTFDWDELLHLRSTYEFLQDQLTHEQHQDLTEVVDAYWREHPKEFNEAFAELHYREDKKVAMQGWIKDEAGNTPAIPRSHWWWWPLKEDNDE